MKKPCITLLLISLLAACSEKSVDEYLVSAKSHIEKKELNAAILDLKNVLQESPKLAEARFLLGKVYLKNYQYENAEKEFERALKYGYVKSDVTFLLAKSYQKTHADNALADLITKDISLSNEQQSEISFYQLQALLRLDKNEKATLLLEKIASYQNQSPFNNLASAYHLITTDKRDDALVILDQVLTDFPTQADALVIKANVLLDDNQSEAAIEIFRQYNKLYPEDLEVAFIFSHALVDNNHTEEAEPIIDRLLKVNEDNMLLNQLKGIARYNNKDYDNAIIYSEKAILNNPKDTGLRLVAGISAYLVENYEKAQQHLLFVAPIVPPSHISLRLLAASQLNLGLNLDASETISRFDEITAQDASLFSSAGAALIQNGETLKARTLLSATPKSGKTPIELARMGVLRLSLNDVSGIINLEDALAQSKTNNVDQQPEIKRVLSTAYIATGQFNKALELAEQWKQEAPEKTTPYMLAGTVQSQLKNYIIAKTEFEAALAIEPTNPEIKMALIELMPLLDQSSTGLQHARDAIKKLLTEHNNHAPALAMDYLIAKKLQNEQAVIADIEKRLTSDNNNAELKLTLAKIYLLEEKSEAAVILLEQIKAQIPEPANFWNLLGKNYIASKQYDKARALYQEWLNKAPNNIQAIIGGALAKESEGNVEDALRLTEQYIQKQGYKNQEIILLHTHLQLRLGQLDNAQKSFDKLSEDAKVFPFSKGLLGQLQLAKKHYKNAFTNLSIAYNAKPSSQNANLIYICLEQSKQSKQAYQFLIKHIEQQPTDQLNLMILARLHISRDKQKAINSYQSAIEYNNNNAIAHNNIAYLYMVENKLSLAKKHAEQSLELKPDDVNILDTLGKIALLRNDNEAALTYLNKAIFRIEKEKMTVDESIHINHIEALLVNGEIRAAEKKVQSLILVDRINQDKLNILISKYNL
jgi:putative PEP-CTERM system TPR-repeat lipoprotein